MRFAIGGILFVSLLSLAACKPEPGGTPAPETGGATVSRDPATPAPAPGDTVLLVIRGTLTSEGVECPALRADDNTLYTLAGRDTGGFKVGDKVCVRGRRAEMSFCQQGITIAVVSIGPASDCP